VEINFQSKSNEFQLNNQIQWDSDSVELKSSSIEEKSEAN
jgi:hypothetical protein